MSIRIEEGEVKKARREEEILYPNINSCLAITAILEDGTKVGGHAVMIPEGRQLNLKNILEQMRTESGGVRISRLMVIGDVGTWEQNFQSIKEIHGYGGDVVNLKGCFKGTLGMEPEEWVDLMAESSGTYDVTITAEGRCSSKKHERS